MAFGVACPGVWGGLSESERDLLLKGTMGRTRGIRRTA